MMQDMDSLSMGILQVRLLEWVAMPSSRGSSQYRDQTCISCIAGRFFTNWATWKAQLLYYYLLKKKKKLPASSWSPCPSWDCPPPLHRSLHTTAFCGFACSSCISRISWSVDAWTWLSTLNHWLWEGDSEGQGMANLCTYKTGTPCSTSPEKMTSALSNFLNLPVPHG